MKFKFYLKAIYNLKIVTRTLIVFLLIFNCSSSWGSVVGKGIWCQPKNLNSINEKKGFFFFDEIKVGSFLLYEPKIKNHRVHFTDLSPYKSNRNKIRWATTVYEYKFSEFNNYEFELDSKTFELKYLSNAFKEIKIIDCKVYSEHEFFKRYKE